MKKISNFVVFLTILVVSCYSVLWFFYSFQVKGKISDAFISYSQQVKDEGGEFSYESVSISGFPLNFDINLHKAKYIAVGTPEANKTEFTELTISTDEKVTLRSEVFGKNTRLVLPKEMNISFADGEKTHNMKTQNKSDLIIEFKLAKSPVEFLFSSGNPYPWGKDRINDNFRGATIEGKEFKIIDSESGDLFVSVDGINIDINDKRVADDKRLYNIKLDLNNMFASEKYYELFYKGLDGLSNATKIMLVNQSKEVGKTSIVIDMSYLGPVKLDLINGFQEANIDVKKISFLNDIYNLDVSGNIMGDSKERFPYGKFDVSIKNYEKMISYYFSLYNNLSKISTDNKSINAIPPAYVLKAIGFLGDIGKLSNNGKDISIDIVRERATPLVVGGFQLKELQAKFRNRFMVKR